MTSNRVMPRHRKQIVWLRETGNTWPQVAKIVGFSRATVQKVYKEEMKEVEPPPPPLPEIEEARVLKMVPNVRMMLIYFEHKEGIGRCIKRPNDNHPPKSMVLVRKIEGEDDLYRKA